MGIIPKIFSKPSVVINHASEGNLTPEDKRTNGALKVMTLGIVNGTVAKLRINSI